MSDVQQSAAPAAGWYPDPAGPGSSRWWSGQAWTDHVQPSAVAVAPEPAAVAVAPVSIAPAYVAPVYAPAEPVAPVAVAPAAAAPASVPAPGMTVSAPVSLSAVPSAHVESRSQEDWHAQPSLGAEVNGRQATGSVSLSTRASASRRHDPYRQRNWTAGLALALALLSIPGLGWRSIAELPALTQSIFAGAPIAVALLGLALSFRRGSGLILSIVAIVISGGVLAAGFLVDPAVLREITQSVLALLPL